MAQTYEQWKKSYESLDDAQKKQYADIAQSKWADYIGNKYLSQYNGASTPSTPKNNTVTETYRWVVDNPNTSWTSNMNSMSQTKAQDNSRNFQVGTGDVAEMPQQPKVSSVQQPTQDNFAKTWNNLTASQQISALTWNKQLTDYINSKWLTVKKEETPVTTTTKPKQTTYTTPKQQEWDYQDNSQARMDEIARNLNWFRQTNPELFQDPSTFYGFFIDGKGRSQDQIDYLWNYYDRVKKYSKYDNMPASSLWEWLADGSIPKDYLDYIKWVDPQKYQEILSYKQDWEDRIKNESYLEDLSSMAWYESEESNLPEGSDPVTYAKKMWYFVDEDGNWTDDNLYIKPTDEERQDVDRINTINARRMEIKNMQKNLLDDLVEQYPWVPKATLMWIVQDRTKDISREYDDLWVELVQLQGTVDYLQNERSMQAEARQQTIKNLDTAYWMYYQYSPEWISELAQSKYAATNITLDQADDWNETQKQMALQNVLDWYYDKYWDIIQRSEQQVINDVIAYAKKNWIWLAQALQENFVQPLQSKEAYKNIQAQLASAWATNWVAWTKVWTDADWNDVYWFVDTTNMSVSPYWAVWTSWGKTSYTPEEVSSNRDKRKSYMSDIADMYWNIWDMANAIAWAMNWLGNWKLECGEYVNDYIYWVTWTKWAFGNEISQKTSLCDNKDRNWVKVGDAIVFNRWINEPSWVKNSTERADLLKYWHVWFITWIDDEWNVTMSHTVGGNVTSTTFNINWNNDYARNFAWSKTVTPKKTEASGWVGVAASYNIQVSKDNNATQNKTYAFAQRAWEADEKIRDYEKKYQGYWDSRLQKREEWGAWFLWWSVKDADQKAYETYKNEFVNAVLRWESWAAIGQTEFSDDEKWAIQRYFPQPWDTLDQIAKKQKLRENYINNMMSQSWKSSDWRSMSDIYQANKLSNYANSGSKSNDEYDWMSGF